jgi:hypothetical protein
MFKKVSGVVERKSTTAHRTGNKVYDTKEPEVLVISRL